MGIGIEIDVERGMVAGDTRMITKRLVVHMFHRTVVVVNQG